MRNYTHYYPHRGIKINWNNESIGLLIFQQLTIFLILLGLSPDNIFDITLRLYAMILWPIASSYDLLCVYQIFSQCNISSKTENVLSISHLKEHRQEYSFLRPNPIFY